MQTKNRWTPATLGEAASRRATQQVDLNDSWFDRAEIRVVAAELRARLERAYRDEKATPADGSVAQPRAAHPGLDDSWFK